VNGIDLSRFGISREANPENLIGIDQTFETPPHVIEVFIPS